MILGIAGTLGSGKGTVVSYLEKKGFRHYSSSGLLKELLVERGLVPNRLNLSQLADELNRSHQGGVLALSHQRAEQDGVTDYILESIHRMSEAEYVRSIGGLILGVDADVRVRFERVQKRQEGEKDNVTFEQFLSDSAREDDGEGAGEPHIRSVIKHADRVVHNSGSLEDLHRSVDEFLHDYGYL